jgi:hypothetical protein
MLEGVGNTIQHLLRCVDNTIQHKINRNSTQNQQKFNTKSTNVYVCCKCVEKGVEIVLDYVEGVLGSRSSRKRG